MASIIASGKVRENPCWLKCPPRRWRQRVVFAAHREALEHVTPIRRCFHSTTMGFRAESASHRLTCTAHSSKTLGAE